MAGNLSKVTFIAMALGGVTAQKDTTTGHKSGGHVGVKVAPHKGQQPNQYPGNLQTGVQEGDDSYDGFGQNNLLYGNQMYEEGDFHSQDHSETSTRSGRKAANKPAQVNEPKKQNGAVYSPLKPSSVQAFKRQNSGIHGHPHGKVESYLDSDHADRGQPLRPAFEPLTTSQGYQNGIYRHSPRNSGHNEMESQYHGNQHSWHHAHEPFQGQHSGIHVDYPTRVFRTESTNDDYRIPSGFQDHSTRHRHVLNELKYHKQIQDSGDSFNPDQNDQPIRGKNWEKNRRRKENRKLKLAAARSESHATHGPSTYPLNGNKGETSEDIGLKKGARTQFKKDNLDFYRKETDYQHGSLYGNQMDEDDIWNTPQSRAMSAAHGKDYGDSMDAIKLANQAHAEKKADARSLAQSHQHQIPNTQLQGGDNWAAPVGNMGTRHVEHGDYAHHHHHSSKTQPQGTANVGTKVATHSHAHPHAEPKRHSSIPKPQTSSKTWADRVKAD